MINSINDLEKVLRPYIIKAMELTEDMIFKKIEEKVNEYYIEYEPKVYQRTDRLRDAPFKSEIKKNGNSYYFTTGFRDDYLTFQYPGNTQWEKNIPASGKDVLTYFNSSSHGGTIKGSHDYWDEVIEELGSEQGLLNLFKQNCKKVGIPIIN